MRVKIYKPPPLPLTLQGSQNPCHSLPSTALTTLFIHIIDILNWDVLFIQYLSELPEMIVDLGTVETLGPFGIKA